MKRIVEMFRWFLAGFVPTLCIFGLIFGSFFVWVNTRSSLVPQQAALEISAVEAGKWEFSASGQRKEVSLPEIPLAEAFEKYPILIPHSVRLAAWGREFLEQNLPEWNEYLHKIITE